MSPEMFANLRIQRSEGLEPHGHGLQQIIAGASELLNDPAKGTTYAYSTLEKPYSKSDIRGQVVIVEMKGETPAFAVVQYETCNRQMLSDGDIHFLQTRRLIITAGRESNSQKAPDLLTQLTVDWNDYKYSNVPTVSFAVDMYPTAVSGVPVKKDMLGRSMSCVLDHIIFLTKKILPVKMLEQLKLIQGGVLYAGQEKAIIEDVLREDPHDLGLLARLFIPDPNPDVRERRTPTVDISQARQFVEEKYPAILNTLG